MEIDHVWLLLLYFCFVIGRGSGETDEFYTTTPPRQSLYLELSSRISKRQQAQERLYDELAQQSLVMNRTGMLIDFVYCQFWFLLVVVKSSSGVALFWL